MSSVRFGSVAVVRQFNTWTAGSGQKRSFKAVRDLSVDC